jgi:hypothetical protein
MEKPEFFPVLWIVSAPQFRLDFEPGSGGAEGALATIQSGSWKARYKSVVTVEP